MLPGSPKEIPQRGGRAAAVRSANIPIFAAGLIPLAAFLLLIAQAARAHEAPSGWEYPISCCSGYDCRPVSAKWIEERNGAFIIPTTGEALPYSDKRIKDSPDGEFHWCSRYGQDDTPTICLFVPPRVF